MKYADESKADFCSRIIREKGLEGGARRSPSSPRKGPCKTPVFITEYLEKKNREREELQAKQARKAVIRILESRR